MSIGGRCHGGHWSSLWPSRLSPVCLYLTSTHLVLYTIHPQYLWWGLLTKIAHGFRQLAATCMSPSSRESLLLPSNSEPIA